jgi:hypothetical protein
MKIEFRTLGYADVLASGTSVYHLLYG